MQTQERLFLIASLKSVKPKHDTYISTYTVMFTAAKFLTIHGGTFNSIDASHQVEAMGILRANISTNAFLDSAERFDAPRCHEGTRQAVIQRLIEWVESTENGKPILWLFGAAGAGKSSITHTFAEQLRQKLGINAAAFFFSKMGRGEMQCDGLIATLVYQLAMTIPELKQHICSVIEMDPTIFSRNLESQMVALIVQPLEVLSESADIFDSRRTSVLIIDGLDECEGREKQIYILSVLSTHLSKLRYPLLCLIASRPECEIKNTFYQRSLSEVTHLLALDVDYRADDDIRLYLTQKLQQIRDTHRMARYIPPDWPNIFAVQHILRKASGQFIYASTVIKFVQDCRGNPVDRLDIILNSKPAGHHTPFAELDALYNCILDSVEPSYITHIHNILAYIFFLKNPFVFALLTRSRSKLPWRHTTLGSLEAFWGYENGSIYGFLADVQSLVHIPLRDEDDNLRILHASLEDYLLDMSRSGKFHLDKTKAFARLAEQCLENIFKYMSNDTMDDVTLKTPVVTLSFLKFPELCCSAYPLSMATLAKLKVLDFARYIECLNRIDLHGIPDNPVKFNYNFGDFIVWIGDHCPSQMHEYDRCICRRFTAGLDSFLHSTISRLYETFRHDNSKRKIDLVLTAIALPPYFFRNFYFPNFVNDSLYPGTKLPISSRASHGFNNRFFGEFLTDFSRSKEHYRCVSDYVDLATEMILSISRDAYKKFDSTCKNDKGYINVDQRHGIEYAMDAILSILSLFPNNTHLQNLLCANPFLFKVEDGRWEVEIKKYMKAVP